MYVSVIVDIGVSVSVCGSVDVSVGRQVVFMLQLRKQLHTCGCIMVLILLFSNKLEKEKKQLAKEAGMIRTEVTGAEVRSMLWDCLWREKKKQPLFPPTISKKEKLWRAGSSVHESLLDLFGFQIAEEMEKERRMFQLCMCEVRHELGGMEGGGTGAGGGGRGLKGRRKVERLSSHKIRCWQWPAMFSHLV